MSLVCRSRVSFLRGLMVAAVFCSVFGRTANGAELPPPIEPLARPAAAARQSPQAVAGTVRTVNSVADTTDGVCDGTSCTLREALQVAQAGDTIVFSSLFATPQTIRLTQALPPITADLTITGPGAQLLTVRRDSGGAYRILEADGGNVSISGLTLQNGSADYGGGILAYTPLTITDSNIVGNTATSLGGGIAVTSNLTLERTTVSDNSAGEGGGIYVQVAAATLRNCTISGNSAYFAPAVNNRNDTVATPSAMSITNCTIADNRSGGTGAVWTNTVTGFATTSLQNTILSGNIASSVSQSGAGSTTTSLGNNLASDGGGGFLVASGDLVNTDPQLLHLATNGGQTLTRLPRLSSPAIDAGNDAAAPATDQRGVPRPQGGKSDIGAVEVRPLVVTSTASSGTGTLNDAITTANGDATPDDIFFSSLFDSPRTILLAASLPSITSDMTITGPGANLLTVRADAAGFSVLTNSSGRAAVSGVTLAGGATVYGSGIDNLSVLTVLDSVVTDNHSSSNGGGIQNGGPLYMVDSTVSGNSGSNGGGLFNFAADVYTGTATLINTTISGNSSINGGDGIENDYFSGAAGPALATLINCTVAGNTGGSDAILLYDNGGPSIVTLENTILQSPVVSTVGIYSGSIYSQVVSLGHNIANDTAGGVLTGTGDLPSTNPLLGNLSNYGGTTPTRYPKPGSPAIDAADDTMAPPTDQRGIARPQGAHADMGAVEANGILIFQDGYDGN